MATELKHFTINNKKFTGRFYDEIIKGINNKYNQIYPNENIYIQYKQITREYTFLIYKYCDIISELGEIIKEQILFISYKNIDSINLFSSIFIEEYITEYDDSKKNYRQQLQEYIDEIIITYRLLELNIESYKFENESYCIYIENKHSWSGCDIIYGYFHYDIITEQDFIKSKRYIKNQLEKCYKKKRRM